MKTHRESRSVSTQGALIFPIYNVIFARHLNQAGAIDMLSPDAKRNRGHLLGLGRQSSRTAVSNGPAAVHSDEKKNRVHFPGADC